MTSNTTLTSEELFKFKCIFLEYGTLYNAYLSDILENKKTRLGIKSNTKTKLNDNIISSIKKYAKDRKRKLDLSANALTMRIDNCRLNFGQFIFNDLVITFDIKDNKHHDEVLYCNIKMMLINKSLVCTIDKILAVNKHPRNHRIKEY